MSIENAVEVKDLEKTFMTKKKKFFRVIEKKECRVVDKVSFNIYKGEVFGLLGPNGAGKTTIIKMITGLLRPDAGYVKVMGMNVDKEPVKALKSLGTVLAGDRSIYWKLTGRENLEYFAALYGCSPKEAKIRADKIIKRLQMEEKADVLVEKFSTGMKQKIALGKALIPEAPVVLLDEPTLGLDPQSALNLREIIIDIKKEGRTVLLTTHYMEEADFLCDRIAIVDKGKVIALDTPEKLKESISSIKLIKMEIDKSNDDLVKSLQSLNSVKSVISEYNEEKRNHLITLHHTNGEEIIQSIINVLASYHCSLQNINVVTPSLEDVFINLTGKSLRK